MTFHTWRCVTTASHVWYPFPTPYQPSQAHPHVRLSPHIRLSMELYPRVWVTYPRVLAVAKVIPASPGKIDVGYPHPWVWYLYFGGLPPRLNSHLGAHAHLSCCIKNCRHPHPPLPTLHAWWVQSCIKQLLGRPSTPPVPVNVELTSSFGAACITQQAAPSIKDPPDTPALFHLIIPLRVPRHTCIKNMICGGSVYNHSGHLHCSEALRSACDGIHVTLILHRNPLYI